MTKDRSFYQESFSSVDELLQEKVDSLFPDYLMSFFGVDRGDVDEFHELPKLGKRIVSLCLYEPEAIMGEISEFMINSGYSIDHVLVMLNKFGLVRSSQIVFAFSEKHTNLLGKNFSYDNEDDLIAACSSRDDFADSISVVKSESEGLLESLRLYCIEHLSELREIDKKMDSDS